MGLGVRYCKAMSTETPTATAKPRRSRLDRQVQAAMQLSRPELLARLYASGGCSRAYYDAEVAKLAAVESSARAVVDISGIPTPLLDRRILEDAPDSATIVDRIAGRRVELS
jgi:hypothetical protein